MNVQTILDDLSKQFGKRKVLYAEDVAEILGISVGASYSLKSRGGLSLPVVETGGRPGVSIYAMAEFLAASVPLATAKAKKAAAASGLPPVPTPKRRIAALENHLKGVRLQARFLSEVVASMEHQILDLTVQAVANKRERKGP